MEFKEGDIIYVYNFYEGMLPFKARITWINKNNPDYLFVVVKASDIARQKNHNYLMEMEIDVSTTRLFNKHQEYGLKIHKNSAKKMLKNTKLSKLTYPNAEESEDGNYLYI